MNKNDECYIVKDLASLYVENLLNVKSKKFVEEHLENCDSCKKYYNDINSNILDEYNNEKIKDKHEVDFLKKIRKKMSILKKILVIILIIILVIVSVVFIKCQFVNKFITDAYDKIEDLKKLDNYMLVEKTIYKDYIENDTSESISTYYYKDGKYKYEYGNTTVYYEDDSYNEICVFHDLEQITYQTKNYISTKKGSTFDIFTDIIMYKEQMPTLFYFPFSIRTDEYNDIECYVIRDESENSYREIWVNKETNFVLRIIEEGYSVYYREEIYTLVENQVTDEDVDSSILDTEEYEDYTRNYTTYNAPDEIKDVYDLIYNS